MKIKNICFGLFLCLVFIVGTNSLYAQNSKNSVQIISIKDGLSHNDVWDFENDKYGYMWIATRDGLNKYDGYNFKIYKNDPADTSSLPSNFVTNVLEDSDGILWISTINGLAKFNRSTETFKNFQFTNSTQDAANRINYLLEDSKGILWLSTNDGILSFDKDKKTFEKYELLREDNVVVEQSFPTFGLIKTSRDELLGASVSYGLIKFDYENKLFIQLKLKNNFQDALTSATVYSMVEDPNGFIWYATFKNLFKIDLDNLSGEVVKNSLTGNDFGSTTGLFLTRDNNMWVGTRTNGLFEYNLSNDISTRVPIYSQFYYSFYSDNTGILWVAALNGIVKYNFDKAPIEQYSFDVVNTQDRPVPLSFSASHSSNTNMWIGTNKGVYSFDKTKETLKPSPSFIPSKFKGNDLTIEDLSETSDGILYLGTTNNGLFACNLANKAVQHFKSLRYDPTSIYMNDVNALLEDSQNRLWIGQELGLCLLNDDKKTVKRIPSLDSREYSDELISFLHQLRKSRTPLLQMIEVGDFADLSKEFVLSEDSYVLISCIGEGILQRGGMFDYGMLQTVEGDTLWSVVDYTTTFNASGNFKNRQKIGILQLKKGRYKLVYKSDDSHSVESYNQIPPQDSLYWGIELYTVNDSESQKYLTVLNKDIDRSYMIHPNVMSVFESSDNLIWVSTMGGLSIIDPKDLSVKNITTETKSGVSLSSNFVEDVCEDNFGNIWIATQDGLDKYDRKKNKITFYKEKDGLPTNTIRALQMDDEGNLWASSIKGISKVEISDSSKTPVFINYDARDGLQGYTFFGNTAIKDRDGKMYFAGTDGFNVLRPGITDKSLPHIVLNNLIISNKSIDELNDDQFESKDLNNLEEIDLSYDQNDITFEFASVHFARPDKNRLQYMMEGIDEEWHDGSKQIATYANLDPGDYIFKVRGSNGDGFWTNEPKTIKVSITPAWWNNTYAYIAYGFLFFGFLYGVRKVEIERRVKVDQFKQSRLRAEAAEAKAIAAEAERKMLEAENDRKTKELEEARSLQLSMLPRELPQLPNLDIAVYMKTATEVGGDYYDFHVSMDGVLTVVLGDATGHGMKAGTMVTTTKSLFNVLAPNPNIVETFHEMTRCLKLMQLEKLSMCMSMLKIANNKVQMSAAGMPPIFIYKQDERVIEEHVFKGMPLGTMSDFPYIVKESEIHSGDSILIMSDGFPELLNDENEAFGYKRARNLFEEHSAKTPEEIISIFRKRGDDWTNNREADDDVTFVVIKLK